MKQKIIFETSYGHTGYKLILNKVYEEKDRLVVLLEEQGLNLDGVACDVICSVVISTEVQLRMAKSLLPVSFYINKKGGIALLEYYEQRSQALEATEETGYYKIHSNYTEQNSLNLDSLQKMLSVYLMVLSKLDVMMHYQNNLELYLKVMFEISESL